MELQKQLEIIKRGVEEIVPEDELIAKIKNSVKTGKKLRIKYGIDPTGYDVHIGHLVPIRKMRAFQDLGHIGVIIIGDYTARIGDPTGKDETRPSLTVEQVKENSKKYIDQLYTVLDPEKTEIHYQTEWFDKLDLQEIIKIFSNFTLAQFMAHETFRVRYEKGLPLSMHEILYPILQAYDSVAIESDVELGATEQKFNILCGRDMQKIYNQEQQIALLSPILMGTDGTNKMSKSLNNYIAVFDKPEDKYGKVMSIPDSLILNYFTLTTDISTEELKDIEKQLNDSSVNPVSLNRRLAFETVKMYHSEDEAKKSEEHFNTIFKKKDIPDNIDEVTVNKDDKIRLVNFMKDNKLAQSNGEARRLIKQGGVSLNGNKVNDENIELSFNEETILKVGKRKFLKVLPE